MKKFQWRGISQSGNRLDVSGLKHGVLYFLSLSYLRQVELPFPKTTQDNGAQNTEGILLDPTGSGLEIFSLSHTRCNKRCFSV